MMTWKHVQLWNLQSLFNLAIVKAKQGTNNSMLMRIKRQEYLSCDQGGEFGWD